MSVLRAENKRLHLKEDREEEQFTFIQAADCQLGMSISCEGTNGIGLNLGFGEEYCNTMWDLERKWCTTFVQQVNAIKPRPKFIVMCGDILDAWPHLKNLDHVRELQRVDFMEMMSKLEVPLVCVCGNHDVGNTPTPSIVQRYRRDFGDDYFSFWSGGVFFIALNSQYHEDPSQVADIAAEHEVWLEEQLKIVKSGKCQHAVIFQHIPYFVKDPNEEKIYYTYPEPLRSTVLERLHEAGVSKIFCGHYHRNGGGWYKNMEIIVTSAVGLQQGDDNNGFRIVNVTKDKIEHKYIELTEF